MATGAGIRSRTVLVVDDEPEILDLLREALEEAGFRVATAPSGEAALEHVSRDGPADAVVLDVKLPGISGIETMGRLRRLEPDLPVVLISGAAPPWEERETAKAGSAAPSITPWPPKEARAFFPKPLDIPSLLATLRQLT